MGGCSSCWLPFSAMGRVIKAGIRIQHGHPGVQGRLGLCPPLGAQGLACSLLFKSSDLSRSENRDCCFSLLQTMSWTWRQIFHQVLSMVIEEGWVSEGRNQLWRALRKHSALYISAQDCPTNCYVKVLGLGRVLLRTKLRQKNFCFKP